MKLVLLYLLIINVLGLLFMLSDKLRATKNKWRIPETRLILVALLGGSIGVFAGMHLFRHKTRHPKFAIGVLVILAVQVVGAVVVFPLFIK